MVSGKYILYRLATMKGIGLDSVLFIMRRIVGYYWLMIYIDQFNEFSV